MSNDTKQSGVADTWPHSADQRNLADRASVQLAPVGARCC